MDIDLDLDKYLGMDPTVYSDFDLRNLRNSFLEIYEAYEEACAEEMAEIFKTPKFDQYSFFGKRKLKKFTQKYADKLATLEVLLEVIQEELDKRDGKIDQYGRKVEEEFKQVSEFEFLKAEQEKTDRIREIISSDPEEDEE